MNVPKPVSIVPSSSRSCGTFGRKPAVWKAAVPASRGTLRYRLVASLFLLLFSVPAFAQLDLDTNLLDDAWELAFFGQTGNSATADPDADGHDNLAESRAATNPLDPASRLEITADDTTLKPPNNLLSWRTERGKSYVLEFTDDLNQPFQPLTVPGAGGTPTPVVFTGNGGPLWLDLTHPANPIVRGTATREVWIDTAASGNVNDFKRDVLGWPADNTPAPDLTTGTPAAGQEGITSLETPPNARDLHGQRLSGTIIAPETGTYTFHLAGRHQCEFWLSDTPGSTDPADLQRLIRQTTTSILEPRDWSFTRDAGITDQQRSAPVTLQAGERYTFQAIHKHNGQEDHLAVGWTKPSDPSSTIEVIGGEHLAPILSADLATSNAATLFDPERRHFRVYTHGPGDSLSADSDGDGIDDAYENLLPGFDPFDASSANPAQPDFVTLIVGLQASIDTLAVTVSDGRATEDPGIDGIGNPLYRDVARFRVERTGSLRPVTIFYTVGGGDNLAAGVTREEESCEPADYLQQDIQGNPLAGSVTLPAGATFAEIVFEALPDGIHEYPETVSLQLDPHPDYTINPASQRGEALLYDVHNDPENELLFVGFSLPQPGSSDPRGSAICSAKLNASRDTLTLFSSITAGFSAPQNNSHIHKDEGVPGSDPVTFSLPTTGEIESLPWPLHDNGAYTPQKMIDSLFNQRNESTATGESKLYINWHTDNNPAGELYAFLCLADGSVTPEDPPPPDAIPFIDPVTQETELRREIVRFLGQSTFGAESAQIDALYADILAHPAQDRVAVFDTWLDTQLDPTVTDQTRALDYTYASDWQGWELRGYFDPTYFEDGDWGPSGAPQLRNPPESAITALPLPAAWPRPNTTAPEAVDYTDPATFPRPSAPYPVPTAFANSVRKNNELGLGQEERNSQRHAFWSIMLNGHDQVRQRLAFAWSQILVISSADGEINRVSFGTARYWDMLAESVDDSFRDLLEGVTYSPMMGQYLSHLKNTREADLDGDSQADVFPDENYAREIMQLFSIGLTELHRDGTLALDPVNGLPQPTYNNADITELARVFTGFSFSRYAPDHTTWNNPLVNDRFTRNRGNNRTSGTYEYPMKMFGDQHDPDPKVIAGGLTINNSTLASPDDIGTADLADVHDWLAGTGAAPYDGHPSTPPFLARRLIQRLVTSNPPSDYIHRVATAFVDSGGNLKAVAKAILLDPYARDPAYIDNAYGRKKPPLIAYLQYLRGLEASTALSVNDLGGDGNAIDFGLRLAQRDNYTRSTRFRFSVTDNTLSMTPLGAPTVFNYYLPAFAPGGPIATAGLAAPEFQILNEVSVIQNINTFYGITFSSTGQGLQALPNQQDNGYASTADHALLNRTPYETLYINTSPLPLGDANFPEWEADKAIVDALDELLCAGALQSTYTLDPAVRTPAPGDRVVVDPDPNPYEIIIDALTEYTNPGNNNAVRDKIRLAAYLITASPAFQIQR